jgi:hypothetical protein
MMNGLQIIYNQAKANPDFTNGFIFCKFFAKTQTNNVIF